MSALDLAACLARAPARTPTAARATRSVSAPAAEAESHRIAAAIGPAFIATETKMAAMYEGPAAQAPLMTPTSDTTQSASKPAATPCNLDEYLGQFDRDERLDTKSVLKAFSPIGREFKFNAESMEKYVAVDGSFRAGDGKVLIPFLLDLVQAKVKGYAADFWLKRFFPDLDITVKPSQTGSTFTLAID